jgi:hypothetical protein
MLTAERRRSIVQVMQDYGAAIHHSSFLDARLVSSHGGRLYSEERREALAPLLTAPQAVGRRRFAHAGGMSARHPQMEPLASCVQLRYNLPVG